jgi:thioredoxin reductase
MHDMIVIGGGLAGLAATLYGARRHLDVVLVSNSLGGKTNHHLALPKPNRQPVLQGAEIVRQLLDELEQSGCPHKAEHVDRVSRHGEGFCVHTRQGSDLLASTVVVASGVRHGRLQVPGEEQFFMRGLSYSAVSYASSLSDETAVIIGDGKLAVRAAAELLVAVKHVFVVGPTAKSLSTPLGKKVSGASNATILEEHRVVEILGDDFARRIIVEGPAGDRREVVADVFFVEQSILPNSQMVMGLLDLEPSGHIKMDERSRTNVPGIYAAGDVTNTYIEQVWVAVGGGAKAALSTYEYLLPSLL